MIAKKFRNFFNAKILIIIFGIIGIAILVSTLYLIFSYKTILPAKPIAEPTTSPLPFCDNMPPDVIAQVGINCLSPVPKIILHSQLVKGNFNITSSTDLSEGTIFISEVEENQFNNSKLVFGYLASYGPNNVYNNCEVDDFCTQPVELSNLVYGQPTCASMQDTEGYKICAAREECSQLNIECVQNEVDLHNAQILNKNITSFLGIRDNCNKNILPLCNLKRGIVSTKDATIYNKNPTALPKDVNAYGWFNDLCIVKGFEKRLKNIVSLKTARGVMGKCIVDPNSPYLTDGDSTTNCDDGGFAPNCLCIVAPDNYVSATNEIVRKQTPREAGLCIDMPQPQICPSINHNPYPNSDSSDPDYVMQSLGKNVSAGYNNLTGVNLSHQYRSEGKPDPDAIPLAGHAEFALALLGMNDIYGECKGYFTYQKNASGIILKPTMSCLNVDGNAVWENDASNSCVRYECPNVFTTGPDANGIYRNDYGKNEVGEEKGRANGFATWSKYTKTNDFMESANAIACIYGFKPAGSSVIRDENNLITGYSGGVLPQRNCNQTGQWQIATNSCQRISCAAINPATPTSANDDEAWNAWYDSGGATFPSVNSSRSNIRAQAESIASGTCNNNLGFFSITGWTAANKVLRLSW